MSRRTKIVCTLGPASADKEIIRRLIVAGMDVARLNFSHGTHETHRQLITYVQRQKWARRFQSFRIYRGPRFELVR
jgi:pyruvate kinase